MFSLLTNFVLVKFHFSPKLLTWIVIDYGILLNLLFHRVKKSSLKSCHIKTMLEHRMQ